MAELLQHRYEVKTPKEIGIFAKTCKGKDIFGNNIFHEIFQQRPDTRDKFLKTIFNEKYHVKIYLRPQYKCCLCCKKYKIAIDAEKPEKVVQIGEFDKRNRLSFTPLDYEFEQPIIIRDDWLIENSKDI